MTEICKLIPENSDYELLVGTQGNIIKTRSESGFEFLTKTAKTNFGVKGGKFMYEVKILEKVETESYYGPGHKAKQEFSNSTLNEGNQRHYVRIGWSANNNMRLLGSDQSSIGYDNNGYKYYGGMTRQYGEKFEIGDVIRTCIEFGPQQYVVTYFKNGINLGVCFEMQKSKEKAWFPAVCVRNMAVELNFGSSDIPEFFPIISEEELINKEIQRLEEIKKQEDLVKEQQEKEKQEKEKLEKEKQEKEAAAAKAAEQEKQEGEKIQVEGEGEGEKQQENGENKEKQQEGNPEETTQQNQEEAAKENGDQKEKEQSEEEKKQAKLEQEAKEKEDRRKRVEQQFKSKVKLGEMKQFSIDIGEYLFTNFATDEQRDYYHVKAENETIPKLILMVGLPSSGKTTFAEQYLVKYPNTIHLSTQIIFEHIIHNLKVQNANKKIILLMELCDEIFIKLMKLTATIKKDVIIDQTNVLLRSRLEKLSYYKHHQNEAVVIITSELEQTKRQVKRESKQEIYLPKCGKDALQTLKENFVIPTESEGFSKVHFVELDEDQSRKVIVLGSEISALNIHPLFRKKNFKEIDEFKAKHNLTKNFVNMEELKQQEQQKQASQNAAQASEQDQQQQQQEEEEEEEEEEQQQQAIEVEQPNNDQAQENAEQENKDQAIEVEGDKKEQEKEQEPAQQESQEKQKDGEGEKQPEKPQPQKPEKPQQQQQKQKQNNGQQQQKQASGNKANNKQNLPKQPANSFNSNQSRTQGKQQKFQNKQNQRNNQQFNRLAEKRNEYFPYSGQQQQQGGLPQGPPPPQQPQYPQQQYQHPPPPPPPQQQYYQQQSYQQPPPPPQQQQYQQQPPQYGQQQQQWNNYNYQQQPPQQQQQYPYQQQQQQQFPPAPQQPQQQHGGYYQNYQRR